MTAVDIIVVVLIGFLAFKGFQKGLVIELFSIVAFILGIMASMHLTNSILVNYFKDNHTQWIPYLIYILVFIAVYLVVFLLGKLIEKLLKTVNLNLFNRIAGLVFGVLKAVFIFSLVVWLSQQAGYVPESYKEKSVFYRYLKDIAPAVINALSSYMPVFKDILSQIEDFFNQFAVKAAVR
jgi:membrane protein required for colicin V production